MEKILKIKDEYLGKSISLSGYKVKLTADKSQKFLNGIYGMGFTEYLDEIVSVSLVDDTIEVVEKTEVTGKMIHFMGVLPEVTPTPAIKKKAVAVKKEDNGDI
jgi:hypothetical protein